MMVGSGVKLFRHRLHPFGADRIDQAFPLVDIVNAQPVELDADERRGDRQGR